MRIVLGVAGFLYFASRLWNTVSAVLNMVQEVNLATVVLSIITLIFAVGCLIFAVRG